MANLDGRPVQHIKGLSEIAASLDLVICDLWGVMHNGLQANPMAVEAIQRLRESGVASVFLSNAPRPRYHVRDQLTAMGIPATLTDYVVTSGGLARDAVREDFDGAKLYHMGPEGDRNTVDGLPVEEVTHPDFADVIFATDLGFRDVENHRGWLAKAREKQVPLLCANPDRVVHVGDKLYTCAGAVADLYESMGGPVRWFGKPTPESLQTCVTERGLSPETPGDKILMIGDSLQTDIAGAMAANCNSLFIAGGIHREEWPAIEQALDNNGALNPAAFDQLLGAGKPRPSFMMKNLVW